MKEIRNILLADDDKNDQFFVKRAFNLLSSAVNVQMVSTGAEAMQYISGCGQFADRDRYPFPELVLTDWKMPQAGGLELLRWMRGNPHFAVVPAIVFSSSGDSQDVKEAYCAGATAYLVKPPTQERLAQIVEDFFGFWRHVESPEQAVHSPCDPALMRA